MSEPSWIEIGYVARAHGLAGELRVRLHNPESDSLAEVPEVLLRRKGEEGCRREVESVRFVPGAALLCLSGVEGRDQAEAQVGTALCIERRHLGDLEEDEYYHFQLIGLKVADERGKGLGKLEEIIPTGANDIFVVRGPEIGELLVPAVARYIKSVDLEAGLLTLTNAGDLLED